jgi:hypothetical protein
MTDLEQKPSTETANRRSAYGWIIALVILLLLIIGFFIFGGMNLFGDNTTPTEPVMQDGYTSDGQRIDPNAPVIDLNNVD